MKKKHLYAAVIVLTLLAAGIQPALAVTWILAPNQDPPQIPAIGTWYPLTSTFTLTGPVSGMIQIDEGNLTLNGNRETVTPTVDAETNGIHVLNRSYVTIKNVNVSGFVIGIRLSNSHWDTLMGNTIDDNVWGIYIESSDDNTVSGNLISGNSMEGIGLHWAEHTIINGNTIQNNYNGIVLAEHSYYNEVYNNNFLYNTKRQAYDRSGTGNVFNLDRATGGNYWDDWIGPDDVEPFGFVDSPYVFEGGQDDLPWTVQDGWSNHPPIANAGPDQIVEQDSFAGASVTLDGSGSSDDGQIQPLTYTWTWAGGSLSTGVNPTVTLPLGTTTVTLTAYDGELSDTDTVDITVLSAELPAEAVEYIRDYIEEMDVPEDAEKEMGKAVKDLNKAIDEFNNDKIDKALNEIAKAVKQLMKAQQEGADTQVVIDQLVALVKGIADEAIEDAIAAVEADNLHVVKAQQHYDKALGNLADGKYDRAIKEFKNAYREAMKALGE